VVVESVCSKPQLWRDLPLLTLSSLLTVRSTALSPQLQVTGLEAEESGNNTTAFLRGNNMCTHFYCSTV